MPDRATPHRERRMPWWMIPGSPHIPLPRRDIVKWRRYADGGWQIGVGRLWIGWIGK